MLKDGKVDFIPDRYRDYCSGRERLYLTLNTAWAKGIYRIRVGTVVKAARVI